MTLVVGKFVRVNERTGTSVLSYCSNVNRLHKQKLVVWFVFGASSTNRHTLCPFFNYYFNRIKSVLGSYKLNFVRQSVLGEQFVLQLPNFGFSKFYDPTRHRIFNSRPSPLFYRLVFLAYSLIFISRYSAFVSPRMCWSVCVASAIDQQIKSLKFFPFVFSFISQTKILSSTHQPKDVNTMAAQADFQEFTSTPTLFFVFIRTGHGTMARKFYKQIIYLWSLHYANECAYVIFFKLCISAGGSCGLGWNIFKLWPTGGSCGLLYRSSQFS